MAEKCPPGVVEQVYRFYKYLHPHPKELLAAKNPPRIFIREGEVYQWRPKERRTKRKYLILFNDLLVVCRKNSRTSYVTKIIFRLTSGSLKCALVSNSSYYIKGVEFRLWNSSKMFVFFGKSPTNALSWVRDIVYAMNGGRLPYRPIMDPKTGEEIDAEGEKKDQDLLRKMEQLREEDRNADQPKPENSDLLCGVVDPNSSGAYDPKGAQGAFNASFESGDSDFDPFGTASAMTSSSMGASSSSASQGVDLLGSSTFGPNSNSFNPFGTPSTLTPTPTPSSSSGSSSSSRATPQREELVPYNPFLSVGANPFNPFGVAEDAFAAPPDWATLLEKAVMELCMIGKSTVTDLEQMHGLDSSLVDKESYAAAKKTKLPFEGLYTGANQLAMSSDAGVRQLMAQNLAITAAQNLPPLDQFVALANSRLDNVKDDFARGRQKYMLQVMAKAIQNVYDLLPEDLKSANQNTQSKTAVSGELGTILESIEEASKTLRALPNQTTTLTNAVELTDTLCELLRAATDAERSLGENAKKSGTPYHRDPAWEEGLISSAKAVLHNVTLLTNSTKRVNEAGVSEKESECDTLLACVRSMNGAVARLLMAARVKIPPDSEHGEKLDKAAGRVKHSAIDLERSTIEESLKDKKEEKPAALPQMGSVKAEREKINAMSKISRLERELEEARKQLSKMNASDYQK